MPDFKDQPMFLPYDFREYAETYLDAPEWWSKLAGAVIEQAVKDALKGDRIAEKFLMCHKEYDDDLYFWACALGTSAYQISRLYSELKAGKRKPYRDSRGRKGL